MPEQKIRRSHYHPNYFLATEPNSCLQGLFDGPIGGIFTGLRRSALEKQEPPIDPELVAKQCHGGPLFLPVAATNTTWVVSSDEILRSLVMRQVSSRPTDSNFLDDLYVDGIEVQEFLKVRKIIDLSQAFGFSKPQSLLALRVYKLPDNCEQSVKRNLYQPHQCAIELAFESTKLLIGYQMDSWGQDHRFLVWADVRPDFPVDKMTICLELTK